MKKNCVVCGKEFEAKGNVIVCSIECRKIKKRECGRKWSAANPEYERKYARKWRAENPEYARKYRAANSEYERKYARKWRAENPEYNRKYRRKKQLFKLMEAAFGGLSKALNNVLQKEKS